MTQTAPTETPPATRLPGHPLWLRLGVFALIGLLIYSAGREGLAFRSWVWDTTAPIRFKSDIDRGFDWGRTAQSEGMLNQYEKMSVQKPDDTNWLDYAPLRLEVMTLWAKWASVHFPGVKHWSDQRSYELTAPLLKFTVATDIAGAGAAFLLVRWWVRRGSQTRPGLLTGVVPGLSAAAILWFNPATVLDGYGWPSYDGWVVPFFLLAAFAAGTGWWFAAGLVLGTGVMLKGQLLGAVPVLAIWAAIAGRPVDGTDDRNRTGWERVARHARANLIAVACLLGGAAVAVAVIASPWLLTSIPAEKLAAARAIQSRPHLQPWQVPAGTFAIPRVFNTAAIVWVIGVLILAAVLPWVRRWSTVRPGWHPRVRRVVEYPSFWRLAAIAAAFAWVVWPWCRAGNHPHLWIGILLAAAAAGMIEQSRPGRSLVKPVATVTATALLLCMAVFNASTAWCDCGFKFGTEHWPVLAVGPTDNAPALLTDRFHWDNKKLDEPAITVAPREYLHLLPGRGHVYSIGQVLRFLSGTGIVLAAIGIGLHARRRDPRVLIALVTPWVWFYCFTPQVQDRYLVFAAAVACICAGISSGMTLLGIGMSVVAAMSILQDMMWASGGKDVTAFQAGIGAQFPRLFEKTGPNLRRLFDGSHPDVAWAVLLVAMIFLYFSLAPRRTGRRVRT